MAGLPEDLTEEILLRVPVKSLLRLKTVSKKWYSLISKNQKFAKSQLKHPSSASKNFIFYEVSCDGRAIFQSSNIDTYESRTIIFPAEISTPCRLIGSANGLICVATRYNGDFCYIWNPCTLECKRIYVRVAAVSCKFLFGFAYDSISDDYKVLGTSDYMLQVFSLKTNSWTMLKYNLKYPFYVYVSIWPFYLNGALHWCVGQEITTFDLAKEEILSLDLPEDTSIVSPNTYALVPLFDYQGSLCASGKRSIWVMKEYGNSKSWAKLTTTLAQNYAKPVRISGVGEVVYRTHGGVGFVKSDIQGRIFEDDIDMITNHGNTFLYSESLISPECFDITT